MMITKNEIKRNLLKKKLKQDLLKKIERVKKVLINLKDERIKRINFLYEEEYFFITLEEGGATYDADIWLQDYSIIMLESDLKKISEFLKKIRKYK